VVLWIGSDRIQPDGSRLALKRDDFEVWDLVTGKLINRLSDVPGGFILDIAFSPDGSLLVVRTSQGSLKVWRVDSGAEILYTNAKASHLPR